MIAALLLAAGAAGAAAQTVHGRVIDDRTGRALDLVTVEVFTADGERQASAVTEAPGEFRVTLPAAGEYSMRLQRLGYAPVSTRSFRAVAGQELQLELRMSPAAVPLEPLRVVGRQAYLPQRLQEFHRRAQHSRQTGRGRVFMREDLQRMSPPQPSALLIHVPSRGGCRPTLLLDGLPVSSPRELDTVVFVDALEGVEIYSGAAQMPQELIGRGWCAVAMFWTRHDVPDPRRPTLRRLLLAAAIVAGGILLLN